MQPTDKEIAAYLIERINVYPRQWRFLPDEHKAVLKAALAAFVEGNDEIEEAVEGVDKPVKRARGRPRKVVEAIESVAA